MAITLRSGSLSAVLSPNAPKPPGLADGDIWVVFCGRGSSGPPTNPVGFTSVAAPFQTNLGMIVSYRVVTNAAGEPASYAFTGATRMITFALVGVDTTTSIDVAPSTYSDSVSSTDWVLPAITTATANAYLLAANYANAAHTISSVTSPLVVIDGNVSAASHASAAVQAGAGSTGIITVVGSAAATRRLGALVAFRELATSVNASSTGTVGTATATGTVGSTTATTNASSTGTAGTATAAGTVGSTTAQANASSSSTVGIATATGTVGSTTATANASSSSTVGTASAVGTVGSTTAQQNAASSGVTGTAIATGMVGATDAEEAIVVGPPLTGTLSVVRTITGSITHEHTLTGTLSYRRVLSASIEVQP